VIVKALPEQTKTLPLYVAAFAELIVILDVIAEIDALKPASVEDDEDPPINAPERFTSANVLVPAKVWLPAVTIPPLVPSAGVKLIVVPLIVAPLALDVPDIIPTVDTPDIAAGIEVQVVPFEVSTLPEVPGATV
jgi:hypothetical protein